MAFSHDTDCALDLGGETLSAVNVTRRVTKVVQC